MSEIAKKLEGKTLFVSDRVSCTSSRVTVQRYAEFLRGHGAVATSDQRQADIVLVDTCAFDEHNEDKSIDVVRQSQAAAKEGAKVIVCGCLAGINPRRLQEHFGGEFFSPKSEDQLRHILGLEVDTEAFVTPLDPGGRFMGGKWLGTSRTQTFAVAAIQWLHRVDARIPLGRVPGLRHALASSQAANPHAYAITISQGCLGNCSFCVIPMAKGKTTSLPIGMIVQKVRDAVARGARKIILTSEDTGAYGKDIGASLTGLLEKVHAVPGDFRIYIHFFDPRWLKSCAQELLPLVASGRIAYIQFPIQSGSDQVLSRMRRGYQIEQVLPAIRAIKRASPGITIATQVIAGFPGETPAEFAATRQVLAERVFDWVQVFEFSNRPGAAAGALPDHLPQEEVVRRAKQLRGAWFRSRYLRRG